MNVESDETYAGESHTSLQKAREKSRVLSTCTFFGQHSADLMKSAGSAISRMYHKSTFRRLASAYPSSTLYRLASSAGEIIRRSRLYRWLTTEPDPRVIEIDLQESYIAGPLSPLLKLVIKPLVRAGSYSNVVRAATQLVSTARTNPIKLASGLLLGLTIVGIPRSWPSASPLRFVAIGLLIMASGIGLAVDNPRQVIATSRTRRLIEVALTPPDLPDE